MNWNNDKKIESKQKIRDLLSFFGMNNEFLNKRKKIIENNLEKSFENFLYIAERLYYDDFYTYTNEMIENEKKFYQNQYEKYFEKKLNWSKKDIKDFEHFIKKRNSDNFLKIFRKNRISSYFSSLKDYDDLDKGTKRIKRHIHYLIMFLIFIIIVIASSAVAYVVSFAIFVL